MLFDLNEYIAIRTKFQLVKETVSFATSGSFMVTLLLFFTSVLSLCTNMLDIRTLL